MALFTPTTGSVTTNLVTQATDPLTFSAWLYLPTNIPTDYRCIFTTSGNIVFSTLGDGQTIDFGTGGSDNAGPLLPLATWNHVAMVVYCFSTTSRQIYGYVNGKQVVNVLDTATFTTQFTADIGDNGGIPLGGYISNAKFWRAALNPAEIFQDYCFKIPSKKSLLFWSPFDESSSFKDISGNNYNWTTVGTGVVIGGPAAPNRPFSPRTVKL